MYTGGTQALMEAQEKYVCDFPAFMFSATGSMIISWYSTRLEMY